MRKSSNKLRLKQCHSTTIILSSEVFVETQILTHHPHLFNLLCEYHLLFLILFGQLRLCRVIRHIFRCQPCQILTNSCDINKILRDIVRGGWLFLEIIIKSFDWDTLL
jgi:hypothetical protein